ncbi:MAG: sugar ABC transporter substrate-binding protein [Prochlorotrichaceae cyanobacterium]
MPSSLCWIICLAVGLLSCHSPEEQPPVTLSPSPSGPQTASVQSLEDEPLQVSEVLPDFLPARQAWPLVYVLKTRSVPYWQRMERSALEWGKALGIQLTVLGADQPQTTEFVEDQILLIDQQLTEGSLKGLILGPADSVQLVPIVEKAVAQGIPVITVDTPLNTDAPISFVGFDNRGACQAIGTWVVEQLGEVGQVLILEGSQHHDNALERSQGFLAGLQTGQEIIVLDSQPADWDYDTARKMTETWLDQYPQVDAIVAANDDMALGAIAALKAANRKKVLVTGFDGSQAGLEAIAAGDLSATIDQSPEAQVQLALKLMITYLEAPQPLPSEVLIKSTQVISRTTLLSPPHARAFPIFSFPYTSTHPSGAGVKPHWSSRTK